MMKGIGIGFVALVLLSSGCVGSFSKEANFSASYSSGGQSRMVARVSDVPENSVYEFDYNGQPAILVNFGGELAAYVNSCTHQGALFTNQSLVDGRIQCPRHGATFKPTTGEYLGHANGNNFGLKGLNRINISVNGSYIYAI